jgi:MSHA biogenesis protein MshI
MFAFAGKHKKSSFVAMVPGELGLSVASVTPGADKPQLTLCDFSLWQEDKPQQDLLAQKVKEFSLAKQDVTTVMDLGDYSILSVEAPDVPPNELRAALRWQIKDLIDFHIDDAVVDVFDTPASSSHGQQNNLYVVVSRTSSVQARVDQLQEAEANLTTIDIPELVLRNITACLPENEAGVAMIYLTRERGLVVVTRDSTLYFARTLDIGYDYLNQASSEGLSLDGSLASNSAFDQLVLEVQRSLDYYDRYFVQPPVAGLVLAPMEVPVPGLDDYLHQALGLSVRYLDICEVVECEQPIPAAQQAHCLAAIGAALRQEPTSL